LDGINGYILSQQNHKNEDANYVGENNIYYLDMGDKNRGVGWIRSEKEK